MFNISLIRWRDIKKYSQDIDGQSVIVDDGDRVCIAYCYDNVWTPTDARPPQFDGDGDITPIRFARLPKCKS